METLRRLISTNVRVSRALDEQLPKALTIDGNSDFAGLVWKHLRSGMRVYDIGGGKQPFLNPDEKRTLGCEVIGIDVSAAELARAPAGAYDRIINADIASYRGSADADVVICRAVLEHVADVRGALASISSILKPGGSLLLFAPCRNAAFARLNLLLPEALKRRILFSVFPAKREGQGFPSHYDHCTPGDISLIGERCGMRVVDVKHYFISSYFQFFAPLYGLWRLWTLLVFYSKAQNFCETFTMILVKVGS